MIDCIFCKIINGEMPCYKIYEDERVLAFLDISNDANGHTLVIPKKHFENVFDCDEKELAYLIKIVQKIARHYKEKCGASGVNIINASGKVAEQSVFHLHFHILPRFENDGLKVFPKLNQNSLTLEEIAEKLRLN